MSWIFLIQGYCHTNKDIICCDDFENLEKALENDTDFKSFKDEIYKLGYSIFNTYQEKNGMNIFFGKENHDIYNDSQNITFSYSLDDKLKEKLMPLNQKLIPILNNYNFKNNKYGIIVNQLH